MSHENAPLPSLDDWDEDVRARYPESGEDSDAFRDYGESVRPEVREFYRQNHTQQTVEFNRAVREKYLPLRSRRMGVWEAIGLLDEIVDESDPDTESPQTDHALQTAERIRAGGHPDWFVLTGLIHDLGKVLCLFDEPQWAVTGDTFPVGCAFSEKIVFHEFFAENPDSQVAEYQTRCGIYEENCGLDNVLISWGHDEYLYQVTKDYLPPEAAAMIRFHSCYPIHREGAYGHLLNDEDRKMFQWVRRFNPYDLYTKHDQRPDTDRLLPYYEELVSKYFPDELQW